MAEFAFNNKIHTSIKLSLFKVNYEREPRISFDIRNKGKNVQVEEDDRLFISQNKSILHSNANLFYSYNIILSLLSKYGLFIKYEKTDIFHFSRSYRVFNYPLLDLSAIGGLILLPKEIWR